jgi:hypothetical protein
MDHRRQALMRIAKRGEQTRNAVEREIDQLRMELQQSRENRIDAQDVPLAA